MTNMKAHNIIDNEGDMFLLEGYIKNVLGLKCSHKCDDGILTIVVHGKDVHVKDVESPEELSTDPITDPAVIHQHELMEKYIEKEDAEILELLEESNVATEETRKLFTDKYRFTAVNHRDAIHKICKYVYDNCEVSGLPSLESTIRTFTTSFAHIAGIRRNAKVWDNVSTVEKFIEFMSGKFGDTEFKLIKTNLATDVITLDMSNIKYNITVTIPDTTASKKEKKNGTNKK